MTQSYTNRCVLLRLVLKPAARRPLNRGVLCVRTLAACACACVELTGWGAKNLSRVFRVSDTGVAHDNEAGAVGANGGAHVPWQDWPHSGADDRFSTFSFLVIIIIKTSGVLAHLYRWSRFMQTSGERC